MNSDVVPDYDAQLYWFNKLPQPILYWVIHYDDKPIGLINLADINLQHRRTSFGFYIGEDEYWYLGGFVLPYFYNFVFSTFPVNKIMAEVFADNKNVWRIHLRHGYRKIGMMDEHIYKNGEYHSMYMLELLKSDWEQKTTLNKFVAKFE
jgi:RimJ/RimL family protein N-acetyltransferase